MPETFAANQVNLKWTICNNSIINPNFLDENTALKINQIDLTSEGDKTFDFLRFLDKMKNLTEFTYRRKGGDNFWTDDRNY